MIDVYAWLHVFLETLDRVFGDRARFVGLQGSYARGEATETSDIDIVVIMDELSAADIQTYNDMLDSLPHRELICGFLSGKKEIMNWEPSDLLQFCHDTIPIKGTLDEVAAVVDKNAVNRAIKIGACNVFHGCVHNMLHEKSKEILRELYKSATFVIQAIAFRQTGSYIRHQKDLLMAVSSDERVIAETYLNLKKGENVDFNLASENLFLWSKKWITDKTIDNELDEHDKVFKLEIFIPETHFADLRKSLQRVDAGHIGHYDCCLSFSRVSGTWRPLPGTEPFIGEEGIISEEEELKVEVTVKGKRLNETIEAVKSRSPL